MSDDTETGDGQDTDTLDADNIVDINRWRDFNDAEPQQLDGDWPAYDVESADEIKSRMLVNIRGCSAPGSLDTSLSHAAGLIEIAACHA